MEITLEQVAMMVECPVCCACDDIGGDTVEACYSDDGRKHVPVHDARMEDARQQLVRARDAIEETDRLLRGEEGTA